MGATPTLPQGWSSLPPGWSTQTPSGGGTPPAPMGFGEHLQKAVDLAATPQPGDKWSDNIGRGIVSGVAQPLVHPLKTLQSAGESLVPGMGLALHPKETIESNPIVSGIRDAKQMGIMPAAERAVGSMGGQAAMGGAVEPVMAGMSELKNMVRPASSPSIVSPEEMTARNVAKTVLPPGGIKPEFLTSLKNELPAVKAYAQRTGNPLSTQMEGMKASQGVASEGLNHYKSQILSPAKDAPVTFEPGQTELGTKTTIGDIDSRITKLNHMIDTSKASSGGQTLDVLAKSKFEDELGTLRKALYDNLSRQSGIPPDKLQQLREGYGGQYSLGNQIEAAENARLTRTGQRSQGQETINLKPPSLLELPSRFLTTLRGGEQAIADRQFSRALKSITPAERSLPGTPPIPEGLRAPLESQNKMAANQEVLKAHDLEQQARSAADERAARAANLRDSKRALYSSQNKLQGESARTIGRDIARRGGK